MGVMMFVLTTVKRRRGTGHTGSMGIINDGRIISRVAITDAGNCQIGSDGAGNNSSRQRKAIRSDLHRRFAIDN